ncbi:MAG: DUF2857 family protein [Betaproteobacteria bacterium]|nr:MAG: DUF2857 family protein [Betaproteobacteria bacterium]
MSTTAERSLESRLIPIMDDALRMAILVHLVVLAEEGGAQLIDAGLSEKDVLNVRSLTGSSLVRLAEASRKFIRIHIDAPGVLRALGALIKSNADTEKLIELIQGSAPPTLLRELFPTLNMKSVSEYQSALVGAQSMDQPRAGRPSMPPIRERDQITARWEALKKTEPVDVDRWIKLRNDYYPQHTYGTLYAVVNELL